MEGGIPLLGQLHGELRGKAAGIEYGFRKRRDSRLPGIHTGERHGLEIEPRFNRPQAVRRFLAEIEDVFRHAVEPGVHAVKASVNGVEACVCMLAKGIYARVHTVKTRVHYAKRALRAALTSSGLQREVS